MVYTRSQEMAMAIMPKLAAGLSLPCSVFLLAEIIKDHREGKGNAVRRALAGMCVVDIFSSSAWFMSTWMVPEGSFALSRGNRATCTYQGFMLQLAIGAPLYNSSLALLYLLMIKYGWKASSLKPVEWCLHFLILSYSVGTSIALLPLEQYNHIGAVCWIIGEPAGCGNSSYQSSDVECERGDFAWIYGVALFYGPLWICVIACAISMILMYQHTKETIERSAPYTVTATVDGGRGSEHTRAIAMQAIFYSTSFFITWMPSTLWSIAHWFNWSSFWLDLAAGVFEPQQGLLNLIIFARTRPQTKKKIYSLLKCFLPSCNCSSKNVGNQATSSETIEITGMNRVGSGFMQQNSLGGNFNVVRPSLISGLSSPGLNPENSLSAMSEIENSLSAMSEIAEENDTKEAP